MANTALAHVSPYLGFRKRAAVFEPFGSGIPAIDRVLRGGVPRAALSEIHGAGSCSRTSLSVAVVARALGAGECCVWVDAGGSFDPESAAHAGMPLERLLWIDCGGSAEHALKATDLLLHGGGFGLVVFDLADVAEREVRRIPMTSWFRLRRAAEETGSALIALTPSPQTRSCSRVCIGLARQRSLWRGKLLRGISSVLETAKHSRPESVAFDAVL